MSLPETIRVKLSSEAAESISLTPVVVQDIQVRELIGHMLGITGKDEARLHELLLRGTLVSGASRFRWAGWEADLESIRTLLRSFPDSDPSRPFAPELCVRAILRGGRKPIEIPRQIGVQKPLLRKRSFWDLLMEVAVTGEVRYRDYSYKERADWYRLDLPIGAAQRLSTGSSVVKYTTLREQIRIGGFDAADLYVERR